MKQKDIIKSLQEQGVRMVWQEAEEKWFLSVIDMVRLLTESKWPKAYWQSLKRKLLREGYQEITKYRILNVSGMDGKQRRMIMIDFEQFLRVIQSIRSPKAENWKRWLAQAGEEVVRETYDPERSLDRALDNWRKMGRDEKWILQRMMSQETRNKLTQYWGSHDIKESEEFRALTNKIHTGWSELTVQEHKELKGLKSQNLRDHMTEAELIFMALAEMAVRQIAENNQAKGYEQNLLPAEQGADIAGIARQQLEAYIKKKVVSSENFRNIQGSNEKMPALKKKQK